LTLENIFAKLHPVRGESLVDVLPCWESKERLSYRSLKFDHLWNSRFFLSEFSVFSLSAFHGFGVMASSLSGISAFHHFDVCVKFQWIKKKNQNLINLTCPHFKS